MSVLRQLGFMAALFLACTATRFAFAQDTSVRFLNATIGADGAATYAVAAPGEVFARRGRQGKDEVAPWPWR